MKKKFKSKKVAKKSLKYVIKFIIIIIIVYLLGFIFKIKLFNSSSNFVIYLLDSSFNLNINNNINKINVKVSSILSNIKINKPVSILEDVLGYVDQKVDTFNDLYKVDELEKMTFHISDPNPSKVSNPIVYIYNSHQLENYSDNIGSITNLEPNVMAASYLLKDKLNSLNIETLVESSDITQYMKDNNLIHKDSYIASRKYIKDVMDKYKDIKLYIDIHRDGISKSASTAVVNNKNCAKVLFVVGLEHSNYQGNLNLANKINDGIKNKYPNLTRGVLTKKGVGVDGIYNQDLSNNMILIEIGGNESSLEEVKNTIDIIGLIIKESLF